MVHNLEKYVKNVDSVYKSNKQCIFYVKKIRARDFSLALIG